MCSRNARESGGAQPSIQREWRLLQHPVGRNCAFPTRRADAPAGAARAALPANECAKNVQSGRSFTVDGFRVPSFHGDSPVARAHASPSRRSVHLGCQIGSFVVRTNRMDGYTLRVLGRRRSDARSTRLAVSLTRREVGHRCVASGDVHPAFPLEPSGPASVFVTRLTECGSPDSPASVAVH